MPSSPEPIISPPKAWACIGLNILAAALVARELWPLAHRAFPKSVFLSSGSPMHFMSQRCQLLLFCAILHTCNCLNFAVHYAIAYSEARYNALSHRMFHALSGQPVIVLVSLATLQRCFALVIADSDSRSKRLQRIKTLLGLLMVFTTCTAAYWAYVVHWDASLTPADRLEARFLASWAFLPATCSPLLCMAVCVWSTFKLQGRSQPGTQSSLAGTGSDASSGIRARQLKDQTKALPTDGSAPRRHDVDSLALSSAGVMSAKGAVLSSSAAQEAASRNSANSSPYPIKRSLKILNSSITAVWIAYAVTVVTPTQLFTPTPFSAPSIIMVYVSAIVKLESSFEKLVKRHRNRRRPVAEEHDPGWGMGGAMSMMENEPAGNDGKAEACSKVAVMESRKDEPMLASAEDAGKHVAGRQVGAAGSHSLK